MIAEENSECLIDVGLSRFGIVGGFCGLIVLRIDPLQIFNILICRLEMHVVILIQ